MSSSTDDIDNMVVIHKDYNKKKKCFTRKQEREIIAYYGDYKNTPKTWTWLFNCYAYCLENIGHGDQVQLCYVEQAIEMFVDDMALSEDHEDFMERLYRMG